MLDLKNITRKQAIAEHRKMWNWIADKTMETRTPIEKKDYVNQHDIDKIQGYEQFKESNLCFCCLYAENKFRRINKNWEEDIYINSFPCQYCPLDWDSTNYEYMCEYRKSGLDGLHASWFNEIIKYQTNQNEFDYKKASKIAREIANLPKKENIQPFGDECEIDIPDEPIDCSDLNYFDELEYDCWDLISQYANKFGIKINSEISFDLAKEIQDVIINQFKNTGVEFNF